MKWEKEKCSNDIIIHPESSDATKNDSPTELIRPWPIVHLLLHCNSLCILLLALTFRFAREAKSDPKKSCNGKPLWERNDNWMGSGNLERENQPYSPLFTHPLTTSGRFLLLLSTLHFLSSMESKKILVSFNMWIYLRYVAIDLWSLANWHCSLLFWISHCRIFSWISQCRIRCCSSMEFLLWMIPSTQSQRTAASSSLSAILIKRSVKFQKSSFKKILDLLNYYLIYGSAPIIISIITYQ